MNTTLTSKIEACIRDWHGLACRWQILHMLFALLATISSLVIATFASDIGPFWTKIMAFTAALSIGLTTTFDIANRGKKYRDAWRHLNEHYLLYIAGRCSEEKLIKAYGRGEATIGHFDIHMEGRDGSAPASQD